MLNLLCFNNWGGICSLFYAMLYYAISNFYRFKNWNVIHGSFFITLGCGVPNLLCFNNWGGICSLFYATLCYAI